MRQSGFSMIEVLVALVIFAFGMLGLASLQSRTLTFGHQSLLRSQAVALTDDVLDRMRVDRKNAKTFNWNTGINDAASSISGSEIYKTELKSWKQAVEALLPEGKGAITVEPTGSVTVILKWNEANATGGRSDQQLKTLSQL